MTKGKVALVGAGPGDPGLLTIRGRELLAAADTVVYDRLVCDDVLACVRSDAKMIYVGKEQSHHPVPQHEINAVLAREAECAELVVRLKGGDPYVFGRGGEEAEYLVERGIDIEVVPGVTSALAALSHAGIPATSRGVAQSVSIITGHARENGELEIDYEALSRTHGTLVFLMAVTSMPQITAGLLAAGMDGDTPAAVVQNGTLPTQRTVSGTLSTIVDTVRAAGVKSPAILVVGGVCALRETLDWKARLPLAGANVVVCRARGKQGALANLLAEAGANVIALPCIETAPVNDEGVRAALASLGAYAWLALTSPVGVERLFEALADVGLDARALAPVKVAAVGASTASALAAHGVRADFVPERFDGTHLGEGLAARVEEGERVLVFRAKKPAPGLDEALSAHGVSYDDVAAYETRIGAAEEDAARVREALAKGAVDFVAFTSASTVEGFAEATSGASGRTPVAACIGRSSERVAAARGFATVCAENSTLPALVRAIIEAWPAVRAERAGA